MVFPLTVLDVSQWLAVIALILLVTSKIISSYRQILVDKKRLRYVAVAMGIEFIIVVLLQIYTTLTSVVF